MDIYKLNLGLKIGIIDINIIRKPIKNVHLKVYRDLKVNLSVPMSVPDEWISKFLTDRTFWIEKQIIKYQESNGYNNLTNIINGSSTQLLGKDMRIFKTASLLIILK
jgi:predicted metal-dependent hydrolase